MELFVSENLLAIELAPFEGGLYRGGADIYLSEKGQQLTALVGESFTTDRSKRPRLMNYLERLADKRGIIGYQNLHIKSILNSVKKK